MPRLFTIRVEIPGLDSLLAYLRDQDSTQKELDAMAVKVADLNDQLQQCATDITNAMATQPK